MGRRIPGRRLAANADEHERQQRGTERRQRILDAAVELFAEHGYRGTDIAAIADKVGMTRPGLLYYFGTKERLLVEVAEERHRSGYLHDGQGRTLKDLRDRPRHNAEHATLTRMYAVLRTENLSPAAPLHDFFLQRDQSAREFLERTLEASIADGQIRPDVRVRELAAEMLATSIGFELQWVADPKATDLARAEENYVDRLLEQLSP